MTLVNDLLDFMFLPADNYQLS